MVTRAPGLKLTLLAAGGVLAVVAPTSVARADCTPAAANNVTATCSGTTTNQGGGAPGTSASGFGYGYGTGVETGVTVNVVAGSTVNGSSIAIYLGDATVTNNAGAGITGGTAGIYAGIGSANVTNSGSITGTSHYGIYANTDATVTNNAGASITAGGFGIYAHNGFANVTNSGSIEGTSFYGIAAATSATVTNNAGASITGGQYGIVAASGFANVNNSGSISSSLGYGIYAFGGGSSVFNAGTISGGGGTAIRFSDAGNTLTLAQGSVITGNVLGTGSDTFQLGGAGSATFDVSQIGAAAQYQGFGTFNKIGSSTWTLTGSTTQVTSWTINAGTLALSGAGALGDAGGTVRVNTGGTLDLGGTTQTQNGGVVIGGGTISNGTLQSSGTFSMQGGTVNAVLAGSGALVGASGTTTLAVANTYTGGTTVDGGTLKIAGAGTLGATSNATRVNGGTLDLGGTTQTQNGGVVIGGGTITNGTLRSSSLFDAQGGTVSAVLAGTAGFTASTGTTTLSAVNTYTGNTTVNSGRLVIAQGGSINSAVTVNGGTLVNNGSSLGTNTINSGGTLGGNGVFGSTTINGGTLSPGNSIGAITIQGNLVLTSASTYMVEVDPNGADRTNVTGTATLGGARVSANFANGSYVSRRYTIVNAQGGVSGTFNSLVNTNLPANFASSLSYDSNNAFLDLALNFTPAPNAPAYTPLTANQRNVANALISSFNTTGGIPLVFGALTTTGLTQVSGEHATGTQQTTFDAMDKFVNVMTDPFMGTRAGGPPQMAASGYADEDESLAYVSKRKRTGAERDAYAAFKAPSKAVPIEPRWSVWGAGYGGTQRTDGDGGAGSQKFTNHVYGSAAGFDYRLTPKTMLGFALGGAGTTFGLANGLGGGRSEVFQAGVYGRHTSGPAYISGALAWGWQDITTSRTVFANGYRANFDANAITGRLEGGWRFAYGTSGITPYAAGQVTSFFLPGYAESLVAGVNTFALAYSAKDVTASRSELGLRGDTSFALADAIVTLRGRAAWAHNFNTDRSISALFQTLPASGFTVFGASPARDSALVTASAETKWLNGFSVAATFEGEFSKVTDSYAGKGMVRYQW